MRLVLLHSLTLCLAIHLQGCTSNQDLGDHEDETRGDGDDHVETGDGPGNQVVDGAQDGEVRPDDTENEDQESPGNVREFGSFESFQAGTLAYVQDESSLSLAIVSEGGGAGCALGSDEHGAPGGSASLVLVRVPIELYSTLCPEGVHAIRDEREYCGNAWAESLPMGCAVFRSWNDDGEQTAEVLAHGGFVSLSRTDDGNCAAELSVSFKGGHRVADDTSLVLDGRVVTDEELFCFH
jgi:hypothetical protein